MVYGNAQPHHKPRRKVRVQDLLAAKGVRPLASITCYDATFARLVEASPMDFVLVGDSLGHVMQGHQSTIGVGIDDICYHIRCVAAALKSPLLVADLPFCSAGFSDDRLFSDAEKALRAGAEAVKIEGASPEILSQISRLTRHGIPVMGHLGLTPQSVHAIGGYRVQGKDEASRTRLLAEAQALEQAGAFSVVLELVTSEVAAAVTSALSIPTVGIGSGPSCDGQILVLQDMLGMNLEFQPKFLKHFARLEEAIGDALKEYAEEVKARSFPPEGK